MQQIPNLVQTNANLSVTIVRSLGLVFSLIAYVQADFLANTTSSSKTADGAKIVGQFSTSLPGEALI